MFKPLVTLMLLNYLTGYIYLLYGLIVKIKPTKLDLWYQVLIGIVNVTEFTGTGNDPLGMSCF